MTDWAIQSVIFCLNTALNEVQRENNYYFCDYNTKSLWQRTRKRRDTITKVGKNLRILKYSNDLYIFTPINRNLMEKSL